MDINYRAWWRFIRSHPYMDSAVLLAVLFFGVGSVRWLGRPSVILKVDGIARRLHPQAKTVAETLVEAGVVMGPEDFCTPPPGTSLTRNTIVHVTRVTHRIESHFERHPPKINQRTQLKANLRPVVVESGYAQEDTETVRATYYDGIKSSEKRVKLKSVRRPVYLLKLYTRNTNQLIKTYDLTKADRLVMRATGYYVGEKYVPSDTTYLGYKLRRGLVAVDRKTIPLRSRLYVKGYGYAYAADTGSAIKGKRIDLAVKDKKEEAKFNRHNVSVYILEKAKGW